MERGAAAVLHSSLLAGHRPSSSPCWPIFTLARFLPHSTGEGATTRRHRQRRRTGYGLSESFRPCSCLSERRYLLMHNQASESSLRVLGSGGPQETSLDMGEVRNDKLLIDCGPDQECVLGGIVALGKFDALHIGHRQLAIQASKAGTPFLLSFVGMAEVLGWQSRPPIVAKCDRKRVLASWAPYCGNIVPLEYTVDFSNVRHLTPRQFVERLSRELRVSGVVAGENYRFGYKAAGDASELVRLCEEYRLSAFIVSSVMDKAQRSYNGASESINSRDKGQVSSTRVRHALSMGDMDYVAELLGRKHRLVLSLDAQCFFSQRRMSVPKSCLLNLPPADGTYGSCTLLLDNDMLVGPATVFIDGENINIELDGGSFDSLEHKEDGHIGIEFG